MLLFIPYRQMEQRILTAVAAAGHPITGGAGSGVPADRPARVALTRLAEAAQVSKQTAGFLVDPLERTGHVERVTDPRDGWARLVSITARGNEAITVAIREEALVEVEWTQHLGVAEVDRPRRALVRLREITDPYAPVQRG